MNTKTCRMCGLTKPTSEFSHQSKGNSFQPYCKPCAVQRSANYRRQRDPLLANDPEARAAQRAKDTQRMVAWRAANPEKARRRSILDAQKQRANAALFLWRSAKRRAEIKEIPFNITPADIPVPAVCPALGIPMAFGGDRENSPSIDRLVPELGYVPGNIRVISYRANRIKTDATMDELEKIVAYFRSTNSGTR